MQNKKRACAGCGHYRPFYSDQYACHYSLDTGTLRGCPAGRECVHYDKQKYIAQKFEKIILTEPS